MPVPTPTDAPAAWGSAAAYDSADEADACAPDKPHAQQVELPTPVVSSLLLRDAQLINREGQTFSSDDVLTGKAKLLYFCAAWCPPCRRFTPMLARTYTALKAAGRNVEVVFISSDQDEASFNEHLQGMPWLALSYADQERKTQLSRVFSVIGVPTLVVLDEDDHVMSLDAQQSVESDPKGKFFPWKQVSGSLPRHHEQCIDLLWMDSGRSSARVEPDLLKQQGSGTKRSISGRILGGLQSSGRLLTCFGTSGRKA